jgi:lipopolysaccharide export system permease protein
LPPILWRYLLQGYVKILIYSVISMIAILLTLRLNEIAHFATLGPESLSIWLFIFYQIPYMLPIAIPLSCLLSSILLILRMSANHELTALRSSGISLSNILTPLLLASCFLSLGNFWIISEVATESHLRATNLKNNLRGLNPLLLMNHKHLAKIKGFHFEAFGATKMGEYAEKALLAYPDSNTDRIALMFASELKLKGNNFSGKNISFILPLKNLEDDFDPLLIENMESYSVSAADFAKQLSQKQIAINSDYLKMPLLLSRVKNEWDHYFSLKSSSSKETEIKDSWKLLSRSLSEIARRFSIALAPFRSKFWRQNWTSKINHGFLDAHQSYGHFSFFLFYS